MAIISSYTNQSLTGSLHQKLVEHSTKWLYNAIKLARNTQSVTKVFLITLIGEAGKPWKSARKNDKRNQHWLPESSPNLQLE
jgi:hypothetical protein